ncbi:DUF423 domain-containing protein [Lutibacter sp.]|uniref:DUF423 domain-containing protein n=1 Tax=Lutibacter sp. TaxID=1925666 RepID=UPI0025C171B3|nr:DUF423 domain-containing protein [Lutibacter sp.]MCF6182819.1 DUF423 domain-containing protein [Lutibacter sp.]
MNKNLTITSILGAITIILGAFGAHALKDKLGVYELKSFETAVKYQMFHVLVLLFVNTMVNFTSKIKNQLTLLFLLGILFFSGSIYAITFGVPAKLIWFITPLGGLLFIIGWLKMALVFYKKS